MKDGKSRIDFILVYNTESDRPKSEEEEQAPARDIYLRNLRDEGLRLEEETVTVEKNILTFIKIYAPIKLLCRYAELLKLRMPMKQVILCS